jgi:dephospho-CoA kinase
MVIGLLGGIGAGKSAVAALFAEAGAEVVDADRLAHQVLLEPGARDRIAARFGQRVLAPDGSVDRKALGERVFSDPQALKELNDIVHPPVLERIRERIRSHRSGSRAASGPRWLVLDVPLLAESALGAECDVLVFVEASPEARRARLRERGWPAGEMERREERQTPLSVKREMASLILDNSGTRESARAEVECVLRELGGSRGAGSEGGEPTVKG